MEGGAGGFDEEALRDEEIEGVGDVAVGEVEGGASEDGLTTGEGVGEEGVERCATEAEAY